MITDRVVSDNVLKKRSSSRLSMHQLHLAYQRKGFDGIYIYTLFTECFQSKVRVTKHKTIINNVAKVFSREITLSELSSHYYFLHFTGYIMYFGNYLFYISGVILQSYVSNYGRNLVFEIHYVDNRSCLYFSYTCITLPRR